MSIEIIHTNNDSPKLFQMPGGEWHVQNINKYTTKRAIVRNATADDLIAMSIWADAVHRAGGKPSVFIPYLPGARQDRAPKGEALSCKVYADIINRCNFESVVCLDPHSDVMPALINNVEVLPLTKVIEYSLIFDQTFVGVIAPDAGATKRATLVANFLGIPVFQALKSRDPETGKLSFKSCEALPLDGKLLVVDDICDGGGTFKQLAMSINRPKEKLALWVTHGIFSNGAENLHEYFSGIYTTDSVDYQNMYRYEHKFMQILHRVNLSEIDYGI